MKTLTLDSIRGFKPCYDPDKYLPEDWVGTVLDILKLESVPAVDRMWVALREDLIDPKTLRLFGVWCAREALQLVKDPDPRSIEACNVAEQFANGLATAEELKSAWSAAESAARSAWSAAESARSAAESAARSAWSAAESARSAARSAAWSAWSAAGSARSAWSAAWLAAQQKQIDKLIIMVEQWRRRL